MPDGSLKRLTTGCNRCLVVGQVAHAVRANGEVVLERCAGRPVELVLEILQDERREVFTGHCRSMLRSPRFRRPGFMGAGDASQNVAERPGMRHGALGEELHHARDRRNPGDRTTRSPATPGPVVRRAAGRSSAASSIPCRDSRSADAAHRRSADSAAPARRRSTPTVSTLTAAVPSSARTGSARRSVNRSRCRRSAEACSGSPRRSSFAASKVERSDGEGSRSCISFVESPGNCDRNSLRPSRTDVASSPTWPAK